jgi:anti-sigma regulatory factor (Ser/Thr protein kinase)
MPPCLALRNDDAELDRLVEFAGEFARNNSLPDEERSRLLIILDELFTNVVKYGYEGRPIEGHIEVNLSLDSGRLLIEFVDDGVPFDPLQSTPPDLDQPVEERPLGGVGLAIVRALVEEAGYRRDGDRNRLTLGRKVAIPPA